MQSFYPDFQAVQQLGYIEEQQECVRSERNGKRVGDEDPITTPQPAVSSLYARNASWNRPLFGASSGHGGGARAVALEAQIRKPQNQQALCEVLNARLPEFDPGHMVCALARLANFGAATSDTLNMETQSLLASMKQNIEKLGPQDVSTFAWSLARLPHNGDDQLRQALSAVIVANSVSFNTHHIANVSWALAKLGCCEKSVWDSLAEEAVRKVHIAAGGELSMTFWAFANCGAASGISYPKLFSAGVDVVRDKLAELSPTSLANISWAFAKHMCPSGTSPGSFDRLFSDFCVQASRTMDQFNGWEVSTLSWAFVTVQMIDEPILSELAVRASMSSLTLQNASSLAWAFAAAGVAHEELFNSISTCTIRQHGELDSGAVSRFVWSYGSLEIKDITLLDFLARFVQENASTFATQDLSSVAVGFVRANYICPPVFDAIASESLQRLQTLGPLELTNILWALSSAAESNGRTPVLVNFFVAAEASLLEATRLCHTESEALSTSVVALRRIGRFESALELHRRLVSSDGGMQNLEHTPPRRERYRLQFRSQDDGYPKQISYAALLMEAERKGDIQLVGQLLESLAGESRSACARSCFLNVAAWKYICAGHTELAHQLLSQMLQLGLFNTVSEQVLQKAGFSKESLLAEQCSSVPNWSQRRDAASDIEKTHSKEFSLLQGVLSLRSNDPSTIIAEMEEFGLKRQWIKVAGGEKAAVIDTVIAACRPTCVLEYGVYVGYNSMRMALHMRPWGGRVVSMEMDPVHVCITRNIALLVGLEAKMMVQIGHSDDAVPVLHEQGGQYDMVFMDQRSTRFHTDLIRLQELGLLRPGCVIVADNVLKPGAPRWLWHITKGKGYVSDIVSVREFGSAETEDWMTVTFSPICASTVVVPPEPPGMAQISAKADRMRFHTVARTLINTRRDLESVNRDFRREFAVWGILRTKVVRTEYNGQGAISEVITAQDADIEEWSGEDPRLDMVGGKWCTNVANCLRAFPHANAKQSGAMAAVLG